MRKVFEAWIETGAEAMEITLGTPEQIRLYRAQGLLADTAQLLHRIEADTPEEAKAVHHIKMGWEPYKPMGKAADCPRGCGAKYCSEGSGECPNCGNIA